MRRSVSLAAPLLILLAALACNMPAPATPMSTVAPAGPSPYVSETALLDPDRVATSTPSAAPPLLTTRTPEATLTPTPTAAPTSTSSPPPTATATAIPSPTPTSTPPPTATPVGCLRPPDDLTRVAVGEYILNARTVAMLEHAQELYGGPIEFLSAVTQGSYTPGLEASFGTHDGGGAVDLSVRDPRTGAVRSDDLEAIIHALRLAGFAAWVRFEDDLYPGSPVHVHAVAVGDAELSPAAAEQLTGPAGYFRGFDGLPVDPPQPDRHGGPVICPWMQEMGYRDLRGEAP